jgi:hypothetical protein
MNENERDGRCRCGTYYLSGTHPEILRDGLLHTEEHCGLNVLSEKGRREFRGEVERNG